MMKLVNVYKIETSDVAAYMITKTKVTRLQKLGRSSNVQDAKWWILTNPAITLYSSLEIWSLFAPKINPPSTAKNTKGVYL